LIIVAEKLHRPALNP